MIPPGSPILSAAQMRAAEEQAAADTDGLFALMERAASGIADLVWRMSGGASILIVCGPGNNGGDGYLAARNLRARGADVRVCAAYPPRTDLARRAAALWQGPVATFEDEALPGAAILVDAVFGTGPLRLLGWELFEPLHTLAAQARRIVAVDLPSGLHPDTAEFWISSPAVRPLRAHHTIALGALKCAHVLPNAFRNCGEIHFVDLGLDLTQYPITTNPLPTPPGVTADSHKYSRGMVGVVAGAMPGAATLAASAAAYAGAGYVAVFGGNGAGPASLVHHPLSEQALQDERLGAVVIGPGLGRGPEARRWVDFLVNETRHNLVIDADALHLIDFAAVANRMGYSILTPHAGELQAMHKRAGTTWPADVMFAEYAITDLASLGLGANPVLVNKGSTTWIARGRRTRVSPRGNPWLSTAGSGDVLAGAIAAMLATYSGGAGSPFDAASAGVWLHQAASRRLGPSFIADDLARALQFARAALS